MFRWSMIACIVLGVTGLSISRLALAGEAVLRQNQAKAYDDKELSKKGDQAQSITVFGKREEYRKKIKNLAVEITVNLDWNLPIPIFSEPVCFLVTGLPEILTSKIRERMYDNANDAGIFTSSNHCKPNVFIIFVEDSGREVSALKRKNATLFFGMRLDQIRAIERQVGPSRAWSSVEIRSRDGDRLYMNLDTGLRELKVSTASQISPALSRSIISSVVLLDKSSMVNLTVNQIADFASMRALAMTFIPDDKKAETILNVFAGRSLLPEMTKFDRGYLKGLYSGNSNDRWPSKIGRIVDSIAK